MNRLRALLVIKETPNLIHDPAVEPAGEVPEFREEQEEERFISEGLGPSPVCRSNNEQVKKVFLLLLNFNKINVLPCLN